MTTDDAPLEARVQFVRAGARAARGLSKIYVHPSDMAAHRLSAGCVVRVTAASNSDQLIACGVAWPMDKIARRGVGLSAMWEAAVAPQARVAVQRLTDAASSPTAASVALRVTSARQQPTAKERALLDRYVAAMLDGVLVHTNALLSLSVHGSACVFRVDGVTSTAKSQVARVTGASTNLTIHWTRSEPDDDLVDAVQALEITDKPAKTVGEGLAAVGGLERELRAVREVVEQPLTHPERFLRFGLRPPRGVLLFGPPGTGKTLLARSLAQELDAKFFVINGPEVVSKFVGESEANVRAVFAAARAAAPALVFIDELDALCPKRDARVGDMDKRLVATLLTLLDGLDTGEDDKPVVVLGATNRPNALDPAVRRPGRFDREVEIGVPSAADRRAILRVALRRLPHTLTDAELDQVSAAAHGYVGADLSALCKEAALLALRRSTNTNKGFQVDRGDLELAMRSVRPSALRELAIEVPRVRWDDIGGQRALQQQLREAVEWPLTRPEAFVRLGIRPPKGVLLYGPPGCSKTLTAKALATESGMNFLAVKGPELLSKWVGESEQAVAQLFRKARAAAPSVVFFDEVDALASSRGGGGGSSQAADRVLTQLLTELDGVEPLQQVLVVAATNRPDLLDPALLRPGRIDRVLYVGPPDVAGREEILRVHTRALPLADDVRLEQLAIATARFSGAELAALCREAAMAAIDEDPRAADRVALRHFTRALPRVTPQIDDAMLAFFEAFRRERGRG